MQFFALSCTQDPKALIVFMDSPNDEDEIMTTYALVMMNVLIIHDDNAKKMMKEKREKGY